MSFFKISRNKNTPLSDLLCHEILDPYDEPAPKMQKLSHKVVEYIPITAKDMETFFALLDDKVITEFMKYDTYCCLADKYLIAMVMTYFKRAGLSYEEYNTYNFFVALHLAHDMEEDNEELKYEFVRWYFGRNWEDKHNGMLIRRDELWMAMNYRGLVSKKCCEEVVAMLPEHPIWQRQRKEAYGGAKRDQNFKWSPRNTVHGTPHNYITPNEYGSGSEVDENESPPSLKTDALAPEDMKSYVINGMGRITCINENFEYYDLSCSNRADNKFLPTFSLFEE